MEPAHLAERVARESYGRLIAYLAARTRDVAAAEDALADAFAAALSAWPRGGVPENPEGWLFAAAKRKLIDRARRGRTSAEAAQRLAMAAEELESEAQEGRDVPDRRLALMFACAHPAIDVGARTALMLQTVLGLSAERIAAAFLVAPAAMGQRLVRAKARIKDAGLPLSLPSPSEWPQRLIAVLEAIYAGFTEGWADPTGVDPTRGALAEEAIWLGRVVCSQLPQEPEALGLLALMLHLDARRLARRDAQGRFTPLADQDLSRWDRGRIAEAESILRSAATLKQPGRFQLEAAIQSAHAARLWTGSTDWRAVVGLYEALAAITGSPVAALNHAAALAEAGELAKAQAALLALEGALQGYQPFWALKAHLAARAGRPEEASAAYAEAIRRESNAAVRAFLEEKRAALIQ